MIHHRSLLIALSLAGSIAAAGLLWALLADPDAEADASAKESADFGGAPPNGPVSYSAAVARVSPSVVNIYSTKIAAGPENPSVLPSLGPGFFPGAHPPPSRPRMETSLGSAVVVSEDGYLLTNHHVIKGASDIKAVLADGRDFTVKVIGSDPETDVAVLKTSTTSLPVVPIGESSKLRVGDVVLAIGNPFGVGQTVTMGIVSATGRSHLGINTYEDFIQTDAAINPGNSGGALINAHGELVGINNAIYSQTGASHGIGFAIPAELALGIMRHLVEQGRVVRSWLGITGQDVTPTLADSFGLKGGQGVMITSVEENGPAHLAGLRAGDVVTAIDGRPATDTRDVLLIVASTPPGSQVKIEGLRGSERFEVHTYTEDRAAHPPPGRR